MKKYFFFFLLLPIFLFGQKPEKIYSIAVKDMPISYHLEQSGLWKKEATQSNSPDAWLNYFAASRMSNLLTKGHDKPYNMDAIVEGIIQKIPNTFEANFIQAWHLGNTDPRYKEFIQKAHQLDPDRPEVYDGFVSSHERKRESEKKKYYNQKWYESGYYSPGMLRWNYNMLMSIQQDGILITHGDGDTYPSWMLQDALDIRTDVLVISLFMMWDKDYCSRVFKELGVPAFSGQDDLKMLPVEDAYRMLAQHLNKHTRRPVYLGVAMSKTISNQLTDSLYIEGLAFRYSDQPYDNIPLLVANFENRILCDHLTVNFEKDISESLLNTINLNYLPALGLLYKHYKKKKDSNMAERVKTIGLAIAEKKGMVEKVRGHFTANE